MRKKFILLMIIALVCGACLLAGCGGTGKAASGSLGTVPGSSPQTSPGSVRETAPSSTPGSRDFKKSIFNYSKMSSEEVGAAIEAIRCAEDSNTGSRFKACDVKCHDGWAMVAVEETNVPMDEAVGFGVYLKKQGETEWEVVQTGTDLKEEDIPGAPEAIFTE